MKLYDLIENIRALWDYVCHGQFGEAVEEVPLTNTIHVAKRDKADKETPNLYVGKIVEDGSVKCEIVSCEKDDFRIKILEIYWDRLGTYMDLGMVYSLTPCCEFGDFLVWEVNPDEMKRQTSQILFAWEKDCGWSWDLDS